MQMYYDRDGKPITIERWGELHSNYEYMKVAVTIGDGYRVSTVWLGIDHSFGGGTPIIFETMIFADGLPFDQYQRRYTTVKRALEGHDETVNAIETMQLHELT